MSNLLLIFCVLFISISNSFARENIVYGEDNRVETFESNKIFQRFAKSTAGMISNIKLIDIGKHYMMPPSSLGKDYRLCSDERFQEQPSPLSCSGFLIAPDLLVTAGHCITNQKGCNEVSWVFDFKIDPKNSKAKVAVKKKNVYKCEKLIDAKLEGKGALMRDYSLVRLDRAVPFSSRRNPLKYRIYGKVANQSELVIIGHPSGLPQKISPKGHVFDNTSKHFFKTNLDSFGGNSGSAVFNIKTGLVEGILVRGATDYISDACGTRVNRVNENIAGIKNLGESVSRITDIDALNKRKQFLQKLYKGDLAGAKKIMHKYDKKFIFGARDQEGNYPIHIAVKGGSINALRFILDQNDINMNNVNDKGETPLHIAAFVNNKNAANLLLQRNANILIKDNFGNLPSQRTNYLAFKFRSFLRKTQQLQKRVKLTN